MDPKFRQLKNSDDLSILKGLAFEEYLKQLFGELGYEVDKTPASGDFGADLVMSKNGKRIVVQAKQYAGQVGFDAVKEIHFARTYYQADEALVITTSGFTQQAVSAASASGITLIDGAELTNLISRALTTPAPEFPRANILGGSRAMPRAFDIECEEGDPTVTLRQYHGDAQIVEIPEGITRIGDCAFTVPTEATEWSKELSKLMGRSVPSVPPEGVVLSKPFCDSPKIKEIVIPEGVERIGSFAFRGCFGLSDINLPKSIESIDSYAFAGSGVIKGRIRPGIEYGERIYECCEKLEKAVIETGVFDVPARAFYRCKALTSVSLPPSLQSIGRSAFWFCTSLTSVSLPSSLQSIGEHAFARCSSLVTMTFPHSLKSIEHSAFSSCTSLTSVSLPPSLQTIGDHAFLGCTSLISVSLPPLLDSIEEGTFKYCKSIQSVDIPEGVEEIGGEAFFGCSSLSCLTLPRSLKRLSLDAFVGCKFIDRGTPAELFDLSDVEIYWTDGAVIPKEWVTAAYEQIDLLSQKKSALLALDDCWRLEEKRTEVNCMIESIDAELLKLSHEEHAAREICEGEIRYERDSVEAESARIKQRLSQISGIHPLKKMALRSSLDKLINNFNNKVVLYNSQLKETLLNLESQRNELEAERGKLFREQQKHTAAIKKILSKQKLPERWVERGRTIPKSIVEEERLKREMWRERYKTTVIQDSLE